ncbi:hypothetical protein EX30DRAFT_356919 [Ascodesmis nigricans]|uniref:Cleavage/polyadenylation specificity factor A subunit C-terminal domain-containing protein n=1 Tax=Ascodesmis nigricans TaxID=341454 RepID=A0A4S2N698_9PEZI|nr:hypothetical protein EX30DRAFT_356919 [Ascodesmis nigricans]
MPEIYTELTPPTSVSHSVTLNFTSSTASNLVVARTTLLQIFDTTTYRTELSAAASQDDPSADRRIQASADVERGEFASDLTLQRTTVEDVTKLVLVAEFPLHGEVTGLARVKREADQATDALLISFKDAKASTVVWDPNTHTIDTWTLHYYEREEFDSPVVLAEKMKAQLVVDPGNRAAVLRFGGDMLAILPVRQKGDEELELSEEVEMGGMKKDPKSEEIEDDDDWDPSAPDKEDILMKNGPTNGVTDEKKNAEGKSGSANDQEGQMEEIFHSSFVVSGEQLDEAVSHIVSLTFLHEYREPTLGILFAPKRSWTGWLEQRQDTLHYIVITLDCEQKASTPILSVAGLPYDLFQVVPMEPPIGGSLLLGANEIVHVDQAGKSTGVAVNPFYRKSTNFPGLVDQSDLCLALEGAQVVQLEGEGGDMLLIMKDGSAMIVGFKMDGRNVSGVKVTKMANHPGALVGGQVTSITSLGDKRLFVSCLEGDSRVIRWKRKGEKKKAPIRPTDAALEDADIEDMYNMLDDDADDDLYGGGGGTTDLSSARKDSVFLGGSGNTQHLSEFIAKGEYIFQTHDRLINLGPFRTITMGRPIFAADQKEKQSGVTPDLEIVTPSGPLDTPEDAGVTIIRRSISPHVVGRLDFPAGKALWTVSVRTARTTTTTETEAAGLGEQGLSAEDDYDRYLFVSKSGETQVFRVGDAFDEVRDTDFEQDGETIEVGTVGGGTRIVQVVSDQVRVYDCDLQLAQIIPMVDEETGEDGPAILKAKICGSYVVLLKIDGSVAIWKCSEKDLELHELTDHGDLKDESFASGSLYHLSNEGVIGATKETTQNGTYILSLLTDGGVLKMYDLANLNKPIFVVHHFGALPPVLTHSDTPPATRNVAREDIIEILLADIGDHVTKAAHLITRNSLDDLTIYKLISTTTGSITFTKITNPILASPRSTTGPAPSDDTAHPPLTVLPNVGGYSAVFLPGADPSLVLGSSHGLPHVHRLAGGSIRSLAPFHTASADRGFVSIDGSGTLRVSLLQPPGAEWDFSGPWSARKSYLNESIRAVTWFNPLSVYAAATNARLPFTHDTEDGAIPAPEAGEAGEENTPNPTVPTTPIFQPKINHSDLVIINPTTWSAVDRHAFAHNEVVLTLSTISLETSEHTHERRPLLAVGTGIFRGEDFSARGAIYVFEVIEVVPEPGRPETNRKLKLLVREEVKGTVSSICGVNGYLLCAQGQKIMVRGLKEDATILPVAFMDLNCYVSVAKSYQGLILLGDCLKSVWFAGFEEEPYKVMLFGKDPEELEVVAGEFLPDGRNLGVVVGDADGNLLVMQYDPEHPKSLAGQRLIRRAAFHTGHSLTSITLLPSSTNPNVYNLLITTSAGSLACLTTLSENSYRRLNFFQSHVMTSEDHPAGLNPKAFRYVPGGEGKSGEMMRTVLDGGMVRRKWRMMEVGKREEPVRKGLVDKGTVRDEMVVIGGGFDYL